MCSDKIGIVQLSLGGLESGYGVCGGCKVGVKGDVGLVMGDVQCVVLYYNNRCCCACWYYYYCCRYRRGGYVL